MKVIRTILGTIFSVLILDKIILDSLLATYKDDIQPFIQEVESISYKVWLAACIILVWVLSELWRLLKQKDGEISSLKSKVNSLMDENRLLSKTAEELKENKITSAITGATFGQPSSLELFQLNRNFVDRMSQVIAVQLYQYSVREGTTNRIYSFSVIENLSYSGEPISNRTDRVEIPKYLYEKLKRSVINGTTVTLVEELILQLRSIKSNSFNITQSVALLTLLNVALTVVAFQSRFDLGGHWTPSLNDKEKEQYIKGLKRTGIVEGIIFNEVLSDVTIYHFIKTQGSAEKIGRWYSAIKKYDQNRIFLITFDKNINRSKLEDLTHQYKEILKKSHFL